MSGLNETTCLDGGIGRHDRLKSADPKGRAGSSPAPGTKREIAAMRSPVYWFFTLSVLPSSFALDANSPKTRSKSLTFVVPSSLTSVGHVSSFVSVELVLSEFPQIPGVQLITPPMLMA